MKPARRSCTVTVAVSSASAGPYERRDPPSELDAGEGPPADESMLVELRLNTVSGDVRIERAAAAATVERS